MAVSSNKYSAFLVCVILLISCSDTKQKLNFTDDIAPIIFENCSPCHHKEGPAPFSMLSYHEVAKRAKTVAYVTSKGYMPPWPADTAYSHFIGEKVLTQEEIQKIQNWYKQGRTPGDTSLLSAPTLYTAVSSKLGEPDLVVSMQEPFFIPGDNKDRFMIAKLPFEIPQDTNIRLIEFVPGNKQLVHHLNSHLITYPKYKSNHMDTVQMIDGQEYSDSSAFYALNIPYSDGSFPSLKPSVSNYLPGVEAMVYPEGIGGVYLTKQSAILAKDLHYGPSAIDDWDQSHFNIYYAEKPSERPVQEFILGTQGLSPVNPPLVIAPNEVKYFESELRIAEDISVLTLNPHMHLIGREFKAYAIPPQGDTIPLIKIDDWNFRWQYFYTFNKILHLPKGTLIRVEALYDNTLNNMDNPYNPPQFITGRDGSMKTTDEMLQLIVSYLPYREGDENISLE